MDEGQWAVLGIVIGAVLGGLAQVLAGALQHRRDRAREDLALRRQAYIDIIVATDLEASAIQTVARVEDDHRTPYEESEAKYRVYVEPYLRRADAMTRLALFAPDTIQRLVDDATNLLESDGWTVDNDRLVDGQYRALSAMRRDFGLRGEAVRPKPRKEDSSGRTDSAG